MARYLLDADALINYANQIEPTLQMLRELVERGEEMCVCGVSLAEYYSGVSPTLEGDSQTLIDSMQFLETSIDAAKQAGAWRYQFARQGRALGLPNALIAATAYHYEATLITGNLRHYPMPEIAILPLPGR